MGEHMMAIGFVATTYGTKIEVNHHNAWVWIAEQEDAKKLVREMARALGMTVLDCAPAEANADRPPTVDQAKAMFAALDGAKWGDFTP